MPIGPGTNLKSMAYVENLIDATLYVWERTDLPAFDVYNYVDLPDLTSREICDAIADALGKRPPSLHLPLGLALMLAAPFDAVIRLTGRNLPISSARVRKLAVHQTKLDAEKIRAAGFVASIPLREGIRRMAEWVATEGRRKNGEIPLTPSLSAERTCAQ